jgi:hypothetical protein
MQDLISCLGTYGQIMGETEVLAVGNKRQLPSLHSMKPSLFWSPSSSIRYLEIPVISRLYFTGAFLTTAGCALDIISPFSLYFNFDLIFHQVSNVVANFSIAPCMNELTELLIIAGADMATDNDIFILRDVFHRLSISHVFSRSVLPLP